MEKKIAGLLGAAALGVLNAAQASPLPAPSFSDALKANSYADLLEPIPNAERIMQALDDQVPAKSEGNVKMAGHHHHHHHHHHGRRHRHHHHHHHHYG